VAGAEAMYTRVLSRKSKEWLEWTTQNPEETAVPVVVGVERPGTNDIEMARSVAIPTQVYPVFENGVRAAKGETIDEHQQKVSELWSRFSEVAAGNPNAWSPTARTPEEIRTITPDNRMIGFPYPKYMNSNLQTDQSAAVVLCSVEAARRLGVAEDRWVFLHSGADGHDHWWISERENLHSSPGVRLCGKHALGLAEIGIDDVAHVDLYSCFPSAVQVAAKELGLGLDRDLTVTGGLCFAGGPGNNYVTHSIASMVEALRGEPGTFGLVTAVGWYLTKHAVGVYSTSPPALGFRHAVPQAEVDALPRRDYTGDHEGAVTVESFTVMHERNGEPALAIVACLTPDGRRTWANSREPALLKAFTTDDLVGAAGHRSSDGTFELA
jgi:acetyl-CoA C-acetyltransferase